MKLVKAVSLYLIWPVLLLGLGFYAGVETSHFFYPGEKNQGYMSEPVPEQADAAPAPENVQAVSHEGQEDIQGKTQTKESQNDGIHNQEAVREEEAEEVLSAPETLCVDTEYVLEETDVLNHTVVENIGRLPNKYVGMDRDQFIKAMEVYADFPPLSEMERGFIGLNVLSFSRDRVVVQMNYELVQPTESFYLAVYDNEVVVYLDDRTTVYIETGIRLDSLPESLQQGIIDMMWIENEEKLYNFLENYSS